MLTVDRGYWKAGCKGFRSLREYKIGPKIGNMWSNIGIRAERLLRQFR